MMRVRILLARMREVLRRSRSERDLEDELRFHFEREVEYLREQGMSAEEARFAARRRFGGMDRTKETYRDARGLPWVETFFQDLRYAARMLRRSPGFAAVAVLSLALGIGANTAIFSLFDAVLLRQMPVREPDRLVALSAKKDAGNPNGAVSWEGVEQLVADTQLFEGAFLQVVNPFQVPAEMRGAEDTVEAIAATGGFFPLLGLRPAAGRLLTPDDDQPGSPPVAVINDRYWQRQFGRDAGAVGSTIKIHGRTHDTVFTIVGVTPPEFYGTISGSDPDITVPYTRIRDVLPERGGIISGTMVRLRPGVSVERALAEADSLYVLAKRPGPEKTSEILRHTGLILTPGGNGFDVGVRRQFTKPLQILMGVVGLVLLLACANLSSLLLARAASRHREIAVRSAVGAGRGRLMRQFLTESLLLTLTGGAAGMALAGWGTGVLVRTMANGGTLVLPLGPDWRMLAFTGGAMLAVCLLVGLAPGVRAAGVDVSTGLREVHSSGRWRLGKLLVLAQVAISMLLVVAAGLFIGTLIEMYTLDTGFERDGVLTFRTERRPQSSGSQRAEEILARLKMLPGATAVSAASSAPLGSNTIAITRPKVEGATQPGEQASMADMIVVAPEFFETQGLRTVEGRLFEARDFAAGNVRIVNRKFARHYFGNESPLGRRVESSFVDDGEIVGVVEDTSYANLRTEPRDAIYLPAGTEGVRNLALTYLVRVERGDPRRLGPAIEAAVREIDPGLQVTGMATQAESLDRALVNERMLAALAGFFGAVALLLAGIGVYGVLSFHVTQRTNEFGVRMALGAGRGSIRSLVLRDVAVVLGIGLVLGGAGAVGLSRLAASLLFGLTPTDPVAFGAAAGVLAAAVVLAAWLPALRASRVDPMVALRHE